MAVKKRAGRPRKNGTATATAKPRRGRPRKNPLASATVTATAKPRRGRPRKPTATATVTATATATPRRKTARKLAVGDCGGKLTRSRLVGGYALKKRVRKPKMKVRRRK